MFLFSCFIFWWQWGRDKEVLIILSLSPLIRVNLLENSGTAGPLQVNDDLKHWVGAVEMIPRPGPRADSRGRAGLPLFLHIFHSFIHSFIQMFIIYLMPDTVLGVKDTATCKTEK